MAEHTAVDRTKLVSLRVAKGWSITKLAKQAGVDYSSYWRIEKGRALNPRYETVQRLASALDVTVEDLTSTVAGTGAVFVPPPQLSGRSVVAARSEDADNDLRAYIRLTAMEVAQRTAEEMIDRMSRRRDRVPPESDPEIEAMVAEINAELAKMTLPQIEEARRCFREELRRHRRAEGQRLQS